MFSENENLVLDNKKMNLTQILWVFVYEKKGFDWTVFDLVFTLFTKLCWLKIIIKQQGFLLLWVQFYEEFVYFLSFKVFEILKIEFKGRLNGNYYKRPYLMNGQIWGDMFLNLNIQFFICVLLDTVTPSY